MKKWLIALLFCHPSFASENPDSAIFLRYRAVVDGPAPLQLSPYRPDAFGNFSESDPIQVRNTIALGRFQTHSPELSEISAACTWKLRPLSARTADIGDPYVRYAQTQAFTLEQGYLGFELRAVYPLSQESRANGLRVGIETHPTLFYAFAQSRWSLESSAGLRVNAFGATPTESDSEAPDSLPLWALHISPGAAYPLSSHLDFTQALHFGLIKFRGSPSENLGTFYEPGVRWQITSGVSGNTAWRMHPYLSIPLLPTISARNWTVGIEVSAILF